MLGNHSPVGLYVLPSSLQKLFVSIRVSIECMVAGGRVCRGSHAEVTEQLRGVCSLSLPFCGLWGPNSDHQACMLFTHGAASPDPLFIFR